MDDAARLFADARVARLATVDGEGQPHLVPIVFVVLGARVWTAVDAKPKSTRALKRLANIEANPAVSLLVDHYDDDWSRLWWVRAEGERALDSLAAKYPQYVTDRPAGPLFRVDVSRWSSWRHGGGGTVTA